jgi:acyl transferase domain-containing protein
VPLSRWDVDGPILDAAAGEGHMRFGSFLPGWDLFDARALGMTPAEAVLVDPQQRLVLEVFQEAHLAAGQGGAASRWVRCHGPWQSQCWAWGVQPV